MKPAGFLLMLTGFALVASALALLPSASARSVFMMAGLAVEILGFGLVFSAHLPPRGER
jgi:hypothetical protein